MKPMSRRGRIRLTLVFAVVGVAALAVAPVSWLQHHPGSALVLGLLGISQIGQALLQVNIIRQMDRSHR